MERSGPVCTCFGRLALRLGLIGAEALERARLAPGPVDASLVRQGSLSPALAARVRELLASRGCRHRSQAA